MLINHNKPNLLMIIKSAGQPSIITILKKVNARPLGEKDVLGFNITNMEMSLMLEQIQISNMDKCRILNAQ